MIVCSRRLRPPFSYFEKNASYCLQSFLGCYSQSCDTDTMPLKPLFALLSLMLLTACSTGGRASVTDRQAPPPFSTRKLALAKPAPAVAAPQPAGPWPAVSSSSAASTSSASGIPVSCSDPEWSSSTNEYRFTTTPVTVTFSGGGTVQFNDVCASATSLQEAICGTTTVMWLNVTCPYNGNCVNGACQPVTCTDTDPNDDPAVKGSVYVNGALASSDACQTSPNGATTMLNQAACLPNQSLPFNGQPTIGPNVVSSIVSAGNVCVDGIVKAGSVSSASSSLSSSRASSSATSVPSSSSVSSSASVTSSSSAKTAAPKSASSSARKKTVKTRR